MLDEKDNWTNDDLLKKLKRIRKLHIEEFKKNKDKYDDGFAKGLDFAIETVDSFRKDLILDISFNENDWLTKSTIDIDKCVAALIETINNRLGVDE